MNRSVKSCLCVVGWMPVVVCGVAAAQALTVPVLPSGTHIRPDNRCWGQKWPWQKAGEKRAADKR